MWIHQEVSSLCFRLIFQNPWRHLLAKYILYLTFVTTKINFSSMATYESVVLVKHEVFVYKIPPRSTNRGYRYVNYEISFCIFFLSSLNCWKLIFILINIFILCRAADWNLNEPTWNGRMRMCSLGAQLNIKLEDKISGQLFANCPVEAYPGLAIEPVSDSSRYFVLRIQDDNGRTAFIGVGFGVSLL